MNHKSIIHAPSRSNRARRTVALTAKQQPRHYSTRKSARDRWCWRKDRGITPNRYRRGDGGKKRRKHRHDGPFPRPCWPPAYRACKHRRHDDASILGQADESLISSLSPTLRPSRVSCSQRGPKRQGGSTLSTASVLFQHRFRLGELPHRHAAYRGAKQADKSVGSGKEQG